MPMALHGKNGFEVVKINIRAQSFSENDAPAKDITSQNTYYMPWNRPYCLKLLRT